SPDPGVAVSVMTRIVAHRPPGIQHRPAPPGGRGAACRTTRTPVATPGTCVRRAGATTSGRPTRRTTRARVRGSARGAALDVVGVVRLDPRHQLAELAAGLLDRVALG